MLAVTAAIAAVSGPAFAQKPFEGTLQATFHTPTRDVNVTYAIKGTMVRVDMSVGGIQTATIADPTTHEMYVLVPAQRMYMEHPMLNFLTGSVRKRLAGTKVTWTGRKETIAGVTCEHATGTGGEGSQLDICIARGMKLLGRSLWAGSSGITGDDWQRVMQDGFPLKVQRAGDSTPQLLVTKIDRKPLRDELFAPPSGWRKVERPTSGPMGRP